tara:strand:- start:1342 stop:1530 length:189 start_codon:yes stop_codon:yes gene_type:complete
MGDGTKMSIVWATALVLVVSSIAWSISWYRTTTTRAALEGGYSKQSLPGVTGTHWVKGTDNE